MTTTAVGHPDYVFTRLTEPGILADPYPYYRQLRDRARVLMVPTTGLRLLAPASNFCFITGHAEAQQAMQQQGYRYVQAPDGTVEFLTRLDRAYTEGLFSGDRAHHTRLRRSLTGYLTLPRVSLLRSKAEQRCDAAVTALVERARDGVAVDVFTELAMPIAISTLCDFIGVPHADGAALQPVVRRLAGLTEPIVNEQGFADASDATDILMAYHEDLIADRRRSPRDDLVSALVALEHEDEDRRLSQGEIETQLWAMWFLGFETVAGSIGNALLQILDHPIQAAALGGRRTDVDGLVSECLRREPPITMAGGTRVTDRPLRIRDVVVPEDTDVRILLGAANRDPEAFVAPDRFDPTRDTSATLTFGHGIHRCVGVHLARMQLSVALPRIHAQLPTLRLDRQPARRHTFFWRTFDHLHMSLE